MLEQADTTAVSTGRDFNADLRQMATEEIPLLIAEIQPFYQTWLYFGLLTEFLSIKTGTLCLTGPEELLVDVVATYVPLPNAIADLYLF